MEQWVGIVWFCKDFCLLWSELVYYLTFWSQTRSSSLRHTKLDSSELIVEMTHVQARLRAASTSCNTTVAFGGSWLHRWCVRKAPRLPLRSHHDCSPAANTTDTSHGFKHFGNLQKATSRLASMIVIICNHVVLLYIHINIIAKERNMLSLSLSSLL